MAVPLLTGWSLCSWRSMNGFSPGPFLLVKMGILLELYYAGLLMLVFPRALSSTPAILVLIITAMQMMETSAFLAMVNRLGNSLAPGQTLSTLSSSSARRDNQRVEREELLLT
eukprot:CAMPEP_0194582690 /NCGR_PEP_ID=MMETSP0292-20121207/15786_1 /TAXON_ID=39354 /ORGANISM="Heterosigma akashiwo, Strain CCMP2393" /LENGTH=112 /DNA_ID=CAMNT_0039436953 /DNA_START=259 /DNA_END=597 /DNA_ORIENTATION=+